MKSKTDMDEKTVSMVINRIAAYNTAIRYLPIEDVRQEVRIVLLNYKQVEQQTFRDASRALNSLANQYGYSRKMGKDLHEFAPSLTEEQNALLDVIEFLYIKQGMSARQIAKHFGIPFSNTFQSRLWRIFPYKYENQTC